jgi:signal transduction histidine kinase
MYYGMNVYRKEYYKRAMLDRMRNCAEVARLYVDEIVADVILGQKRALRDTLTKLSTVTFANIYFEETALANCVDGECDGAGYRHLGGNENYFRIGVPVAALGINYGHLVVEGHIENNEFNQLESAWYLFMVISIGINIIIACAMYYAAMKYLYKPIMVLIEHASSGHVDEESRDCRTPYVELKEMVLLNRHMRDMLRKVKENELMMAMGRMCSMIAHDMRSPLSVLKGYVDKEETLSTPEESEYQHAARRCVQRLLNMAADLVDYAKASSIQKQIIDINSVLSQALFVEMGEVAEGKNISLRYEAKDGVFVFLDPRKMERVMVNIVVNAIQAIHHDDGLILISVHARCEGDLVIEVKDNGQGMDANDVEHMFDDFFTKGKKGGTGLGLAYCKQVVDAHCGNIEVVSQLNSGTRVSIVIPNCIVNV